MYKFVPLLGGFVANAKQKAAVKAQWAKMTAEERSAEMKRRVKLGRQNRALKERQSNSRIRHGKTSGELPAHITNVKLASHVSYLYGKVETIIEYYANSNGIPLSALTEGVASLLQHKESR